MLLIYLLSKIKLIVDSSFGFNFRNRLDLSISIRK